MVDHRDTFHILWRKDICIKKLYMWIYIQPYKTIVEHTHKIYYRVLVLQFFFISLVCSLVLIFLVYSFILVIHAYTYFIRTENSCWCCIYSQYVQSTILSHLYWNSMNTMYFRWKNNQICKKVNLWKI